LVYLDLFLNDFQNAFLEIFLSAAILLVVAYGVVSERAKVMMNNVANLSVLSVLLAALIILENEQLVVSNSLFFYNTFISDPLSYFLKTLILGATVVSLLISLGYYKRFKINGFEYSVLVLLAALGMLLTVTSNDLISMYLSVELQSLCLYLLAGSRTDCEFSTESALKYFVLGAFSSGLLLFGCAMVYGFSGLMNFEHVKIFLCAESLTLKAAGTPPVFFGFFFLICALLFKLSAAPFHFWVPDVYEGAPTCVTAFFAITTKIAFCGLLLRIFSVLSPFFSFWQWLFIFFAFASLIISSLSALAQRKLKKLMALSSVGHVGYLLMGFCCDDFYGQYAGAAILVYIFLYVFMTIGIFTAILCLLPQENSILDLNNTYRFRRTPVEEWKMSSSSLFLADLHALGRHSRLLSVTVTVFAFSMAGIPPLAGFYAKLQAFSACLASGAFGLALVGVICSTISCFFYIRLIQVMLFEAEKSSWSSLDAVGREKAIILSFVGFFLCLFFLFPDSLYDNVIAICY
jgi:NADH-quinone oxidoreductase subunit N